MPREILPAGPYDIGPVYRCEPVDEVLCHECGCSEGDSPRMKHSLCEACCKPFCEEHRIGVDGYCLCQPCFKLAALDAEAVAA
jgi:hypothetical protein